jgi:xanthine/uracil permease
VFTLAVILLCGVLGRGLLSRASVLVGMLSGWLAAALFGGIDSDRLADLANAAWFGFPQLTAPELRPNVVLTVLPVVVVLVAENVGHVKAVASVTGRNLDGNVGDALIANGLSTALAGIGGGSGTTTYAENIGVMTATKVYSTAAYAVAAVCAIGLSFCPKFGTLLNTMPTGVLGGAMLLLYGLIALVGVRIWLDNRVDLLNPVNLMIAGAALVAGVGNLTVSVGGVALGGIAWGSLLIVVGHPLLRTLKAARH